MTSVSVATERDYANNRWLYVMNTGEVIAGPIDGARIPCGLPVNDRMQRAADLVFKAPNKVKMHG